MGQHKKSKSWSALVSFPSLTTSTSSTIKTPSVTNVTSYHSSLSGDNYKFQPSGTTMMKSNSHQQHPSSPYNNNNGESSSGSSISVSSGRSSSSNNNNNKDKRNNDQDDKDWNEFNNDSLPVFYIFSTQALADEYASEHTIIPFTDPPSFSLDQATLLAGVLESLLRVVDDIPVDSTDMHGSDSSDTDDSSHCMDNTMQDISSSTNSSIHSEHDVDDDQVNGPWSDDANDISTGDNNDDDDDDDDDHTTLTSDYPHFSTDNHTFSPTTIYPHHHERQHQHSPLSKDILSSSSTIQSLANTGYPVSSSTTPTIDTLHSNTSHIYHHPTSNRPTTRSSSFAVATPSSSLTHPFTIVGLGSFKVVLWPSVLPKMKDLCAVILVSPQFPDQDIIQAMHQIKSSSSHTLSPLTTAQMIGQQLLPLIKQHFGVSNSIDR